LRKIQSFGRTTESTGCEHGLETAHFVTFDGHGAGRDS